MTREARIGIQANFLFGDPAETEETLAESLRFQDEHHLYFVDWSAVIPYPGTQVYAHAEKAGLIPDREQFLRSMGDVSRLPLARHGQHDRAARRPLPGAVPRAARAQRPQPPQAADPGRGRAGPVADQLADDPALPPLRPPGHRRRRPLPARDGQRRPAQPAQPDRPAGAQHRLPGLPGEAPPHGPGHPPRGRVYAGFQAAARSPGPRAAGGGRPAGHGPLLRALPDDIDLGGPAHHRRARQPPQPHRRDLPGTAGGRPRRGERPGPPGPDLPGPALGGVRRGPRGAPPGGPPPQRLLSWNDTSGPRCRRPTGAAPGSRP